MKFPGYNLCGTNEDVNKGTTYMKLSKTKTAEHHRNKKGT